MAAENIKKVKITSTILSYVRTLEIDRYLRKLMQICMYGII